MITHLIEYLFEQRRGLLKQVDSCDKAIEKMQSLKEIAMEQGKDITPEEAYNLFVTGRTSQKKEK